MRTEPTPARLLLASMATCLALSSNLALADIYRVVDKDGNVTFTDQPPENGNAENIQGRIDEAVERNTTQSLKTQRENDPAWVKDAREEREKKAREDKKAEAEAFAAEKKAWQQKLEQAKNNLKEAKAAQKKGEEVIEGDFIGKAGGGARPSEQYYARQLMLEERVIQAEKALKEVKKSKPRR